MTSFTKFTMSAPFLHQKKKKSKINIGTVRNAPAIPDNYITLFYPGFHQPEFRNITSPWQRKKLGTISEWLAKAQGKKIIKKLQMQHIQTLQLKKKCDN